MIYKQVGPLLLSRLAAGVPEERHVILGCVACLLQHSKVMADLVGTSSTFHKLLLTLAQNPELVPKMEAVLPALIYALKHDTPGWADMKKIHMVAAQTVRRLIEISDFEEEKVKQERREMLVGGGTLVPLVHMLGRGNVEAQTASSACLRFLALSPGFIPAVLEADLLPVMSQILTEAKDEPRSFICGALWDIAADPEAASALAQCGGVQALMAVVSDTSKSMLGKTKKRPEAKLAPLSAKRGVLPPPPPPDPPAVVALCNATGALLHMSFLDEVKKELGEDQASLNMLVNLLKSTHLTVYDNVVGTLWNLAMDPANQQALKSAHAPKYLISPVPSRWLNRCSSAREVQEARHMGARKG